MREKEVGAAEKGLVFQRNTHHTQCTRQQAQVPLGTTQLVWEQLRLSLKQSELTAGERGGKGLSYQDLRPAISQRTSFPTFCLAS